MTFMPGDGQGEDMATGVDRAQINQLRRERRAMDRAKTRAIGAAESRKWRAAHPLLAKQRSTAAVRKWRAAHPGLATERERARCAANREAVRARARRWYANNLERARAISRANELDRRARKMRAFVEHVDPQKVYARDAGKCGICSHLIAAGDPWHIDHIVALARGGEHSYSNVQLAHAACNIQKGTRAVVPLNLLQKAG